MAWFTLFARVIRWWFLHLLPLLRSQDKNGEKSFLSIWLVSVELHVFHTVGFKPASHLSLVGSHLLPLPPALWVEDRTGRRAIKP